GRREPHPTRPGRGGARGASRLGWLRAIPATPRAIRRLGCRRDSPAHRGRKKKPLSPPVLLAQEEEIQQLIARYQSHAPHGAAVAELERLVRTAVFKSANALVGWLLQQTVER